MAVRIGVDVGGTFTKAVACDAATGAIVCRSVVPTTHASPRGVAEGVVATIADVDEKVRRAGAGPILLVAHSTTQAVNALLEGDAATVGVLGIGRPPDLRRARKRTMVGEMRLAPGRRLRTLHSFLDAGAGLEPSAIEAALRDLVERGAQVVCVSEAFGVEDAAGEVLALEVANRMGVPACAGHELSGLYGLEMRTVTAALNASILPTALATAQVVEEALTTDGRDVPLLVMRGDGGAADIDTMRRRPLLTAFSGPAASVSGALRHLAVHDAIVIEVGGTSTNVSAIVGGRPVLSYVRVLEHVTCVRSLDVRVAGVAGGSMLRVGRKMGRARIVGVGPRSAHIAGLAYCAYARAEDLAAAEAHLVAPRPGDPPEYVALETPGGLRFALTVTCAANALGHVPEGAYARTDALAAQAGFRALGRLLGRDWNELARDTLRLAAASLAPAIADTIAEHRMQEPTLVGVGGGAGALVPELASALGLGWSIPTDAEVISSVGDALSLVRVELERGISREKPHAVGELIHDVEEAAVAAGADPNTLQIETHAVPERSAVRAVALGAVALTSEHEKDGSALSDEQLDAIAVQSLEGQAPLVARTGTYSVFATPGERTRRFAVLDSRGAVVARGEGIVLAAAGDELAGRLTEQLGELTRHLGPFTVSPALRLVRGRRLIDLSLISSPTHALEAALAECTLADGEPVVALLSRS